SRAMRRLDTRARGLERARGHRWPTELKACSNRNHRARTSHQPDDHHPNCTNHEHHSPMNLLNLVKTAAATTTTDTCHVCDEASPGRAGNQAVTGSGSAC